VPQRVDRREARRRARRIEPRRTRRSRRKPTARDTNAKLDVTLDKRVVPSSFVLETVKDATALSLANLPPP